MTRKSTTVGQLVSMNPSRRPSTGSGYPQWMRTLEEKYQKLHKKITENTGHARFTNYVGRTVYDPRISQAINKCRSLSIKQSSSNEPKTGNINLNRGNADLPSGSTKDDFNNQYLDRVDTNSFDKREIENCENVGEFGSPMQCDNQTNEQTGGEEFEDEEDIAGRDANNNPPDFHEDGTEQELMNVDCQEFVDEGDNLPAGFAPDSTVNDSKSRTCLKKAPEEESAGQYDRGNLKTSVSRASKLTTKSCPAKIQTKPVHHHTRHFSHPHGGRPAHDQRNLLPSRGRITHRHKMFTPMSAEAKHAITETIQEMSISTGRTDVQTFVPSRGRVCVKNWTNAKATKSATKAKPLVEDSTQYLQPTNVGESMDVNNMQLDNLSCLSSAGSDDAANEGEKKDSRLPEISSGSARDRHTGRSQSFILPGIGKFNIDSEEPVFEITPLGYDIRYNDVEPHEERESETPPPDIRQRAIDKCSEWLTKYNK